MSELVMLVAGMAIGGFNFGMESIDPFRNWLSYQLNSLFPIRRQEVAELIELYKRKVISAQHFYDDMKAHGFNQENADLLLQLSYELPAISDLIEARRRGLINDMTYFNLAESIGFKTDIARLLYDVTSKELETDILITLYLRKQISEDEFYKRMKALGFEKENAEKMLKAYKYYPSPSEIIDLFSKGVFDQDVISKFGLAEDLTQEFVNEMSKAGVDEDQAKVLWAGHWQMPSIDDAFEMYHRGIISFDDLKSLFKALDIAPYWRDKYLQLSFNPFTRIDVRRMYSVGILDEEDVYKNYLALGYDPDHAKKLTEWTKIQATEEEHTITKTQILELFEIGEFSEDETKKMLIRIGYDDISAEYLVELKKHEISLKHQKETVETLTELYVNGAIDEQSLFDNLTKLNLSADSINNYMLNAINKKRKAIKLPSKDDLHKWLKQGLITPDEFIYKMKRLNYLDEDIELYLKEAGVT